LPAVDEDHLWSKGFVRLGPVMSAGDCVALRALYAEPTRFRSTIDMERFRFGRGEYRYFSYPLPDPVGELREGFYAVLAPVANAWCEALGMATRFPSSHAAFIATCHASGQTRCTALMLHYRNGGYNCLHQDLYGPIVFPFQVIVLLSAPDREFSGGEIVLVEQRPRAQSIAHTIRLEQGEALAISTRFKPVKGKRGMSRGNLRHGVSEVRSGERFSLGLIFHDAE
jgi:hypothetical protein